MAATMIFFLALSAIVLPYSRVAASYYGTTTIYSMNCGRSTSLSYMSTVGGTYGKIILPSYPTYSSCVATFYCPNTGCRLYFRAESNILCSGSTVNIYDGSSTSSSRLASYDSLSSLTSSYMKTTSSYLTISYSEGAFSCGESLLLRHNAFKPYSICGTFEFECDNGWCINSDLDCDGYENCSDGSDEDCYYSDVGAIVGAVVGCVTFIIFIGVIVAIARRRRRVTVVSYGQAVSPAANTTIVAGATNQGYGVPPPTQYNQYPGQPPMQYAAPPPMQYAAPPPMQYAAPPPPYGVTQKY